MTQRLLCADCGLDPALPDGDRCLGCERDRLIRERRRLDRELARPAAPKVRTDDGEV